MSKQSDELKKYFDQAGILQRELAQQLGMHEGTVSSLLSGRYGISKKVARKLSELYGFDLDFLLSGDGALLPIGGVHVHQSQRVSGNGTGIQTVSRDQALAAEIVQLREQLEQAKEEKNRLLGIIETLTKSAK
ncbi:MAG: helix-turn-helix transcriptional regulator [Bacteroidales bacterium]|nr:helix-turn-helix transcriptional regulator [Bacteroidales bacterium]